MRNKFQSSVLIIVILLFFEASIPLFGYSYSWDLRTDYPFVVPQLDQFDITADLISRMNRVDANYTITPTNPSGTGITAAQLQQIKEIAYDKYAIVRNSQTGQVTGRLIILDGEGDYNKPTVNPDAPAGFNSDWLPDMATIDSLYKKCSTAQKATIELVYRDMVELWLNVECFPGSGVFIFSGNGYSWRDYAYKCLNMSHTLPEPVRQYLGLSLFYYSGGGNLLSSETNPVSSTDLYHNIYHTMFKALSVMNDDAFKWQVLHTVCHQLDKAIIGTQADNCLITLDGGIIHHWGHHIHYASYSFLDMVKIHRILAEAGFTSPLTPQAVVRFRKAALAWSWTDTNGNFPVHYNMRPTYPSKVITGGKSLGNTVAFLKGVAELTAAYRYQDSTQIEHDLEMAYPAIVKAGQHNNALPIQWQDISLPVPASDPQENWYLLNGHLSFQVNGSAAHRRENWMASIRGAHIFRRGGEAYDEMGKPDHFHEMSMRGSLLLITEGFNGRMPNCADSGYYFEGWDHNYYPNVTNYIGDLEDHLYWRSRAYFSGKATQAGGANLFDNGVWFYIPSDGTCRKSAFFFDKRITLVTSEITFSDKGQPVVTGLIQQGHSNFVNNSINLDGTVHSGTGSWTMAAGGDHHLVDINGNAYYIHPNTSTPMIKAERGVQSWPYGLSEYYIGPGIMPSYIYKDEFITDVRAGYFSYSTGNYSKVYFDHGSHPVNDTIVYSVLVKPQAGELDTFVNNMKTPGNEPLKLDTSNNRHLLYDVASNSYAAVLFTDNQSINQGGLVSASRMGAYIWQNTGTTLRFSCGSSYMTDTSPFVVVFSGRWFKNTQYDTDFVNCVYDWESRTTTVTMPYREFASQKIILTSEDMIHMWTDLHDFANLSGNWLFSNCDECSDADISGDGNVNFYDLRHLVELWLGGSVRPVVYTETFKNLTLEGWGTQTYIGDNGNLWNINAKGTSGYIDGSKCIYMIAGAIGVQSNPIPGGIQSFSVTCKNLWDTTTERKLELLVNGIVVDSIHQLGTDLYVFAVEDINIPGNVTLGIRNATTEGTGNRSIAIDNITWSSR